MSIYRGKTPKEFFLASLLYDSIEDQDLGAVTFLLKERGADPNIVLPKKGISPFHLVIGNDSGDFALKVTRLILQYKGNPNVRSDDGLTPVHIAAAWGRLEILKLLLNCGGDPNVYDLSHKTPVHYAFEENFPECLELLKLYLPDVSDFFSRNDKSEKYTLVLDKVIIDNGTDMIIEDVNTDSISNNNSKAIETLESLPQTKSNDYVKNWCNKHQDNKAYIYIKPLSSLGDTPVQSDYESSLNESDSGLSRPYNFDNLTFKKVYRKTRKSSNERDAPKTPKQQPISRNLHKTDGDSRSLFVDVSTILTTQDFSKFSMYSKESGIMTLPSSYVDSLVIKSPVSENFNKVSVQKDTSSDYLTCSFSSELNLMEQNVFELTDDLSQSNIAPVEEANLNQDSKSVVAKMNGTTSTDLTFVSVSEVYKYEDKDEGVVLYERRFLKSPSSDSSSSLCSKLSSLPESVDTNTLRRELTSQGYVPGPITLTTKQVYLKKLRQLRQGCAPVVPCFKPTKKVYSFELEKTLRDTNWHADLNSYKSLEDKLKEQFENPDPSRKWREGLSKTSFTYLLLDPRITNNLPCRAETLKPSEVWETFLSAIFYVGKGKRNRPYAHLYEAVSQWNQGNQKTDSNKLQRILDIWKDKKGVVCLHIFQNIIPVEAYTREAAMIHALKLENVENIKKGDFYGIAATWSHKQKKMLGVYLLHKALQIFLHEGERQLSPTDIA